MPCLWVDVDQVIHVCFFLIYNCNDLNSWLLFYANSWKKYNKIQQDENSALTTHHIFLLVSPFSRSRPSEQTRMKGLFIWTPFLTQSGLEPTASGQRAPKAPYPLS